MCRYGADKKIKNTAYIPHHNHGCIQFQLFLARTTSRPPSHTRSLSCAIDNCKRQDKYLAQYKLFSLSSKENILSSDDLVGLIREVIYLARLISL